MATKSKGHFSRDLFLFLRELAANNERPWFEANKARYESDVRQPMLRFVTDFGPRLAKISKRLVADPRPSGGSIFRIHRDVRFAKDKSPYKTQAALQFRHASGKDVHAPGFYLHLEPGRVFGGSGIWHPEPEVLAKIRQAIVERPKEWKKIAADVELAGEKLSRPPRGLDPEHPLIEELKRKDFISVVSFTEKDACSPDFIDQYFEACRSSKPLMAFLTRAVGLEF